MQRPFTIDPPVGRKDPRLQGRDGLITELATRDSASESGRAHILYGLGGSGKSAIALEVARRLIADGWRVWWINARSPDQISAGMREVAGRLGASPTQLELTWAGKARSPVDLVWELLSNPVIERWLLIFDNADQPYLLAAEDEAGDVSKSDRLADENGWIRAPQYGNGMVLVTTRDGSANTWGTWSNMRSVGGLKPEDAAQVLLDIAGETAGTADEARALAQRLRCHALTLRNAGMYLRMVNEKRIWPGDDVTTFAKYLERLEQRAEAPRLDGDPVAEVHKTWEVCQMSLDQLSERKLAKAGPLLHLLATFGDAPVSYALLLDPASLAQYPLFRAMTQSELTETLLGLADFGLLELEKLDDPKLDRAAWTATLHPLVRELSRSHLRGSGTWPAYNAFAVQMLQALQPEEPGTLTGLPLDPDNEAFWPMWHVVAPQCIDVILDHLDGQASSDPSLEPSRPLLVALDVARLIARYQLAFGLPKQAELFMDECLQRCRGLGLDMDSRPLLSLRHERARAAYEQGQLDWAEQELRLIIPLRSKLLGAGHLDTLFSRHKLARVLMEKKQWADAEVDLRLIVEGEAGVCGPEDHNTLTARHSLARAVLAQGHVDEAASIVDEILAIRERDRGPDEFDTLVVRITRAQLWLERGQIPSATEELRHILAEAGKRHMADHPEMISARQTLAKVLLSSVSQDAGDHRAEGTAALRAVADSLRRTYGADHPEAIQAAADIEFAVGFK